MDTEESLAERKRKRLEAWKLRRQQAASKSHVTSTSQTAPIVKPVKLQLSLKSRRPNSGRGPVVTSQPIKALDFADDDEDEESDLRNDAKRQRTLLETDFLTGSKKSRDAKDKSHRRRGKWDVSGPNATGRESEGNKGQVADSLDKFMQELNHASGKTTSVQAMDMDGSLHTPSSNHGPSRSVNDNKQLPPTTKSRNGIDGNLRNQDDNPSVAIRVSDKVEADQAASQAFIEALKQAPIPQSPIPHIDATDNQQQQQVTRLAADVKSEKQRREQHLRQLEEEAEKARLLAQASSATELGRLYNDVEGGVMEEAERNLDAAMAAPDALQVLAELNKKKELKAVDHSTVDYIPFNKNLYIVPRALSSLTSDEIANLRGKLKVRVRGLRVPAPVTSFSQCGLSERILHIMEQQKITKPFPVQAQCLPCIMAGRDVIGIAKTGSGKTLAYLLPMLRHILDQPPLAQTESGPIGLVLAPARELAYQIHLVCKEFTKQLGIKSTAVYGGAGVAEQIGDLKRGTHVCVATPGRLIDILTMQSGKILSLRRVTYVVMDEADRMYDMGFAPQISAILAAVRPDRQVVLFSATFPKSVEGLARKSLKYPVEVIVGGRSVASDNVTQYAELVEEDDKFLRLLQLLGEHVDEEKKAIVFVDTQIRADSLFEQLLRNGYMSLSLHGGKEQEDRDSTIAEFKRKDGHNVLVATGVAGRGLDVTSCACVINYSCPNHLEAYVHQVGRTGRAGNKGVAFTMVNSAEEAKYAPSIVRALSQTGQSEHISAELKELAESFKSKVERGEAKWASSGFKGKGYTYDASEMNEAQKLARLEKRQALIEAGLLDPDDDDQASEQQGSSEVDGSTKGSASEGADTAIDKEAEKLLDLQTKLTPELLALPGMKDAILRRAGIVKESENETSVGHPVQMGTNHFVQEFEINDYPREARWKVTQKETTSRLQDEFQTAVTLKGEFFGSGRTPAAGERKLYLHLEATSERILENCVIEIKRLLNEETLRVGSRSSAGGGGHRYSVL